MSLFKLRLLSLLLLFFQTGETLFAQETEAEVKVQAEKLFLNEQYIEATPLFSRLIALNPKSTEYNYKFGTCLLFNSFKKQDAFKYLNYSVSDPNIDPQAYFFLGKAYQLNFQFNEAIKNYELYLKKVAGKENPKFQVQHQIQTCHNGKNLLTTLSDLVVLDKKEIAKADFFRLYNLSNIGGSILVTTDFQSKVDKKKNHVPLIHFPQNAQMIFYSSYGESDKGNKDIYVKKRQANGSWGDPELVTGGVNTNFDEDYPYMAPGGTYLYFSSKGHNSMGGYDIFRCKYDKVRNTFGEPENLDFAISSPDDDLFYVVDSLEKNAYFASSRQSQDGKIHVYNVRVDRVPLQLSIIKGTFASSVNPSNKKVQIKVTDFASGRDVGIFNSNENGDYLINLPKGGKYVYEIKVAGSSTTHKATVNVPFTKELRPLKQKMEEAKNEDMVIVKVTDLFSEDVEDAQAIIAEVIRNKAELNVNSGNFDLSYLDKQKEEKKVLASLGLDKASNQEIISHFESLESKENQRVTELVQMSNGSQVLVDKLADEVAELQSEVKRTVNEANKEEDAVLKNNLLLKANDKVLEIEEKKAEIVFLKAFEDSVSRLIPAEQKKLADLKQLTKDVQEQVVKEDFNELKNKIIAKIDVVNAVQNQEESSPVDALLHKNEQLGKQKDKLEAQNSNFDENDKVLTTEIKQLEASLEKAKPKDKEAIQSKIDAKKQELTLVQEEKDKNETKIKALSDTQNELTNEVTFINTVQHTEAAVVPNKVVVNNKLTEINSNNNKSLESYIKEQVKNIDKSVIASSSNSSLVNNSQEKVKKFEEDYALSQDAVDKQSDLTPEERQALKHKNNEQYERKIDQELAKIDQALAENPEDEGLKTQQIALQDKKSEIIKQREELLAATTSKSAVQEKLVNTIDPKYADKVAATENLAEKDKLNKQNDIDNALIDELDKQLNAVYDELVKDPLNNNLQQKKEALTDLKKTKEVAIQKRDSRLEEIENNENQALSDITPEKELEKVVPNHKSAILAANGKTGLDREEALKQANEKALQQVNKEIENLKKQGSGDKKVERRLEALSDVKADLEAEIAANKANITQIQKENALASTPSNAKAEDITKKVTPNYQDNVAKISASSATDLEKNVALVKEEEQAISAITKAQAKVDKALEKTPNDSSLLQEKAILDQLGAIHDEKLNNLKEKQTSLASTSVKKEQVEQDLLPGFVSPTAESIESATSAQLTEIKQQDAKLLNAVEKEIKAVEKQQAKSGSPELAAKLAVLNEIKNDIQQRKEAVLGRESVLANSSTAAIPSLQEKLGASYDLVMEAGPKSVDEGKGILQTLTNLEKELSQELKAEKAKNPADEANIKALTEQLNTVVKRKGVIEMELAKLGEPVTNSSKTSPEALSKEITPKYEANVAKIEASNQTDAQKTNALIKEEQAAIQAIEKAIKQTDAALTKNPNDTEKQQEKTALSTLKTDHGEKLTQLTNKENSTATNTNPNVVSLSEKLGNSYTSVMESTPTTVNEAKEVLSALNQLEQDLDAALTAEKAKKPANEAAIQTLTEQKNTVAKRKGVIETELEKLNASASNTTSGQKSAEQLAKEVTPNYEANVAKINASNQSEAQKTAALIQEEQAAIQAIDKAIKQADAALAKTPNDAAKQAEKKSLEELKAAHEEKANELKTQQTVESIVTVNKEQIEQDLVPGYQPTNSEEIAQASATDLVNLKKQDALLQTATNKEIKAVEKQQAKNPSPELVAKLKVLNEIKNDIQERKEAILGRESVLANASQGTVPSLSEKLGASYNAVMESTPSTAEEAKEVLNQLTKLEQQLSTEIKTESAKNPANEDKINALTAQKLAVQKRKGIIEVDLAEMESKLVASSSSIETPKTVEIDKSVANLEQEAMSLQQQKATASKAEQKQIDKKLAENAKEQAALKAEKETIQQAKLEQELTKEIKEVTAVTTTNPLKEQVTNAITQEKATTSQETAEQITLADQAKNFLQQENLSDQNTVLNSEGALKEQRRRFVIEIGDLTQEIAEMKQNKAPQAKIEAKEKLKTSLESAVQAIDSKLTILAQETAKTNELSAGSTAQVSPKQEQEIASDSRYAKFLAIQKEINKQLNERAALANAINDKRRAFDASTSPETKKQLSAEIKAAQAQLAQLDKAIAASNQRLDEELGTAGVTDKAAWKNVLSREVSPAKSTEALAEKFAPVVKDGFEFTEPAVNPIKTNTSIPVGVQAPTGLVYRVQVGAFAKPIPENLFQEFTPVTGEKLDNGITRYLAGYFGDRNKVVEAQKQIRQLGYADAFVVAYCDGKRISLAEARRMEDEGLCKPMRMDSIVMQVIENTIAKLPADTIAKYKVEPKVSDYNKAPNAAPAVAIEEIQALFYTVQIGVYNRPASSEELKFVTPVVTRRLPNGQIRYATGTFRSIDEARPKRLEAIDKGIKDAFITAYYKGERIPLGEAAKLLQELGPEILIKESDLPKVPEVQPVSVAVQPTAVEKTPEVKVVPQEKYTLVSKNTYPSYPRKEINRLRVYGDFYYDANSKHIVSVETTKVPALGTSGVEFDTLVETSTADQDNFERNPLQIVASWDLSSINGSTTDWLLHLTVKHQIKRNDTRLEVELVCSDAAIYEALKQKIIRLGGTIK